MRNLGNLRGFFRIQIWHPTHNNMPLFWLHNVLCEMLKNKLESNWKFIQRAGINPIFTCHYSYSTCVYIGCKQRISFLVSLRGISWSCFFRFIDEKGISEHVLFDKRRRETELFLYPICFSSKHCIEFDVGYLWSSGWSSQTVHVYSSWKFIIYQIIFLKAGHVFAWVGRSMFAGQWAFLMSIWYLL